MSHQSCSPRIHLRKNMKKQIRRFFISLSILTLVKLSLITYFNLAEIIELSAFKQFFINYSIVIGTAMALLCVVLYVEGKMKHSFLIGLSVIEVANFSCLLSCFL